jgi:hypothetical protein
MRKISEGLSASFNADYDSTETQNLTYMTERRTTISTTLNETSTLTLPRESLTTTAPPQTVSETRWVAHISSPPQALTPSDIHKQLLGQMRLYLPRDRDRTTNSRGWKPRIPWLCWGVLNPPHSPAYSKGTKRLPTSGRRCSRRSTHVLIWSSQAKSQCKVQRFRILFLSEKPGVRLVA